MAFVSWRVKLPLDMICGQGAFEVDGVASRERAGWGGEGKGVGKELDRGLRTLLPSPPMFTTLPFFSSFAELVVPGVLCVLLHP